MRHRDWRKNLGRLPCAVGLAAALAAAGCCPQATEPVSLNARVAAALTGHAADAATYAGLYAVLAERLEARAYATTDEFAAVAGQAAKSLRTPGLLNEIVGAELDPLLGRAGPLTPELSAKAAAKLRELSAACAEAAQ